MRNHARLYNPEFFFSLTRPSTVHAWRGEPCMDWIRKSMVVQYKGQQVHVRRLAAFYGRPHLTNRLPRTPGGWEKRLALKTPPKLRQSLIPSLASALRVHSRCGNHRCINPLHLCVAPGSMPTERTARHTKAVPANPRTLIFMEPPPPVITIPPLTA